MKRKLNIARGAILLVALAGLVAMPAIEAQTATSFTTMESAGTSVHWTTTASPGELVLSVTGPGFVTRQVHAGGESPSLKLTRADGNSLLDGTYNWEIRESFAGINDGVYDPANGRDGAETASPRGPVVIVGRVDSGVFTIKNGFVVDSTVIENDAAAKSAGTDREVN